MSKFDVYIINQNILSLIDPETGEITDPEAFESLNMERSEKLESLAMMYKNLAAGASAIKAEIKSLQKRQKKMEHSAESTKEFLQKELGGESLETARVQIHYRKTSKVAVDENFVEWAQEHDDSLLTYKAPTPSLAAIKDAINAGRKVEHAEIVESQSMSIK